MKKIFILMIAVLMCSAAMAQLNYERVLRGSGVQPFSYPGSEFVWFIQTSTDEVCVPIRTGGEWRDNNVFQDMQKHTWAADNKIILSAWNYCYDIIAWCNAELRMAGYSPRQQAEIRLVRAYAYLMALDMFRNIPIIDENHTGAMPRISTRTEVFSFIENELNNPIMDNLHDGHSSEGWNQAVLNTLKARLYLNSNVYLAGDASMPLADTDIVYARNLEKVIEACNKIIASNQFEVSDYFRSFYVDSHLLENSQDIIYALPYNVMEGTMGNYLQMLGFARGTEYALGIAMLENAVNGPVVNPGKTADDPNALYNIFDTRDIRRLSILSGQLKRFYEWEGFWPNQMFVEMQQDNPLYLSDLRVSGSASDRMALLSYNQFFTGGFSPWHGVQDNNNAATRGDGARMLKYEMIPDQGWEMDNDLVLMRYTEVLYSKAEALIRLGRGSEAIPIFQEVLAKRGYNGANIGYGDGEIYPHEIASKRHIVTRTLNIPVTPTLDFMEKEWRREFVFEGRRRTDMIRFGSFFGTWGLKDTPSESDRAIFPIPQAVLAENPSLLEPSSIFTPSNNASLQIYPNPTADIVYLNTESSVRVYNLQGTLLQETVGTQVDLSAYPQGLYLLQADGAWAKVIKK